MRLITPTDVREYTNFESVQSRREEQLNFDILQAETDIFDYCGHDFSDTERYPTIPEEVKLSAIKLAEYYALINSDESLVKGITSERLGDYSYQIGKDGETKKFSLRSLLKSHVQQTGSKGKTFKVRAF